MGDPDLGHGVHRHVYGFAPLVEINSYKVMDTVLDVNTCDKQAAFEGLVYNFVVMFMLPFS